MKPFSLLCTLLCCYALHFSTAAQIRADKLESSGPCNPVTIACPNGVINPENAVDKNPDNYAVIRTAAGIVNTSYLKLQFTQYGLPGMFCKVFFQKDESVLTADVISALTITLYDDEGIIVGKEANISLGNVEALNNSGSVFGISVRTKPTIKNIAAVKIELAGLVNLLNSIRVYKAVINSSCEATTAGSVHNSDNVQNVQNVITNDNDDYALLTPPLLAGVSFIDVNMESPVNAGKSVSVVLGEGNIPLSVSLLQNLSIRAYDGSGNVIVFVNGFTTADVTSLNNGRFSLKITLPAGGAPAERVRITLQGLVNVLTTMKVYNFRAGGDNRPEAVSISSASGTRKICNGETITLSVNSAAGISYQWYKDNAVINGATASSYSAMAPGYYFVVIANAAGCSFVSNPFRIVEGNCGGKVAAPAMLATVYPNPFSQFATIAISNKIKSQVSITISDKSGRVISTYSANAGASIKVLTGASGGLYMMKVVAGTNTEYYKLIKN